jgi:hypothetical protein
MEAPAVKRPAVTARRARAAALASAAALTLVLAGCSTQSPATITTPYPAADGMSATIPGTGIKLNNFLVVSPAKGSPGQLIGAVVNESSKPVVVTMQTDVGQTQQFTQTTINVPAHGITPVGPSGTELTLADTPVPPGALISISANYQPAGGIIWKVPVVPPTGIYASYTVAPTTAPATPTSSPGSSPDAGATPSGSASPAATSTNS